MRSTSKLIFSALLFILAACNGKYESDGTPVLMMNTRYMREEPVSVTIGGVSNATPVTVDFGDGTIVEGKAGEAVSHVYEGASEHYTSGLGLNSGYVDHLVKATVSGQTLEKTIRVYDLLCITSLMKWLIEPGNKTVLNMTHRANTTNLAIPENSISAVKACIAAGVEAIETDTHITSDGVVVISHDPTINRCTNGTGTIANMTYAEIQHYYLKDRNGKVTSEKMPTLEEFLKAGRGKIYYDIDYSPRTASTSDVLSIVSKLDMMEQVWFYCNTPEKIAECLALNPKTQVYFWVTNYQSAMSAGGKYFTQCSYTPSTHTSPSSVTAAEAAGCLTSVITLDDVPTDKVESKYLDELLGYYPNVRMIMNNVGDAMLKALQDRGLHD